jgi:hypothetical protein
MGRFPWIRRSAPVESNQQEDEAAREKTHSSEVYALQLLADCSSPVKHVEVWRVVTHEKQDDRQGCLPRRQFLADGPGIDSVDLPDRIKPIQKHHLHDFVVL